MSISHIWISELLTPKIKKKCPLIPKFSTLEEKRNIGEGGDSSYKGKLIVPTYMSYTTMVSNSTTFQVNS